jgi:hypothetical protein
MLVSHHPDQIQTPRRPRSDRAEARVTSCRWRAEPPIATATFEDDGLDQGSRHPQDGLAGELAFRQVPVAQQQSVEHGADEGRAGEQLEERQQRRLVAGPGEAKSIATERRATPGSG